MAIDTRPSAASTTAAASPAAADARILLYAFVVLAMVFGFTG